MNIYSINVLIEALKTGTAIDNVMVADSRKDKRIALVVELCRKKKIPFNVVPVQELKRKAGPDYQGVSANMTASPFMSLDEALAASNNGLILILDGITDTGNMGAIIRSAVAADVDAIIISERHSAPINETVLKTSAGTLLKARMVRAGNLNNTVKTLKEKGFWIVGTEMNGDTVYYDYDFSYPAAIILGSEGKGMSQLLKKNADHLLTIPYPGKVESLNVSVSSALILFEALKQKKK